MWELDHKEGWAPNNWCFQTVVLEKILESPLDFKEIKPVNPKGNQPWIFIGRTDWCWNWSFNILATWLEELTHGKRPRCCERLKVKEEEAEEEMVRQKRWLNEHELEQTLGDGWGQGSLLCMGLQRVGYLLATEQQQSLNSIFLSYPSPTLW